MLMDYITDSPPKTKYRQICMKLIFSIKFSIVILFISEINLQMIIVIIIATILFLTIVTLFLRYVPELIRNTPTHLLARTMTLCAIYPVVATAALTSVLVPRAIIFCDTICHMGFTICAYQFYW